jgi:tetratricopeptide (TPR) repeat protein
VPSSIEKLILRGLTKKPGDRYQNAETFLAAVEHAMATAEGGQTAVEMLRAPRETGSQPLVGDDGGVELEDNSYEIGGAIEEALAVAPVTKAPARSTPPRGGPAHESSSRIVTKVGPPPVSTPLPPTGGRGGVGIGLPFTGPTGEPIFGLTPQQRLSQGPDARKKKLMLYGGIAVAAIVVGVIIAVVTRPSSAAKKVDPATPAGRASELLERGNVDGAIKLLEDEKDKMQGDANAWLVLGHAHAARNDIPEALLAYRTALAVDPTVESNKRMRASLRTMAADQKNEDVIANAYAVWIQTTDEEAKSSLFKAVESPSIARRHAAITVMDQFKLGGNLERIQAYSLDLQDQPTCPLRAAAVAKLRAIGDPQAIPALQRAVQARGTRGAYKNKPINGCLIDDANAAIGFLESLKKK